MIGEQRDFLPAYARRGIAYHFTKNIKARNRDFHYVLRQDSGNRIVRSFMEEHHITEHELGIST